MGAVVTSGPPQQVMQDPLALAAYLGASQEALARSGLLRPPKKSPRAARPRRPRKVRET
jgi:hypothetical protein